MSDQPPSSPTPAGHGGTGPRGRRGRGLILALVWAVGLVSWALWLAMIAWAMYRYLG